MVVVKKQNGTLRLCTDGRALKPYIERTKYAPVTLDSVKHKLSGAKYFSKIDLRNGYFQIKLNNKSRKYTTFATHVGLFRYKRLNMGISSSAEIFQNEITRILLGITNQVNISDDIFIYRIYRYQVVDFFLFIFDFFNIKLIDGVDTVKYSRSIFNLENKKMLI